MATTRSTFIDDRVTDTAERREFYERLSQMHLAPLWSVLANLVTKTPKPEAVPALWRFADIRRYLVESIDLVTTEEAERRVLVLENPALPGKSRITDSLYAGLQIIAPGETAPAHRHQASALRFLVEGSSAYTAVNGEKTMMCPGDFVVTPSWAWHDHACVGDHSTIWLDVLDLHIVNMLSGSFREESLNTQQDYPRPDGASISEFSRGVVPANHQPEHNASPIINYRYSAVKDVFDSMQSHRDIDEHFGHLVRYIDPTTGAWALPTIASQMRFMPQGFESKAYRSSDATIFNVVEGHGESEIGGETFSWQQGDVFVVPQWLSQRHRADVTATLFTASDRAIQEKIGIWREQRLS